MFTINNDYRSDYLLKKKNIYFFLIDLRLQKTLNFETKRVELLTKFEND